MNWNCSRCSFLNHPDLHFCEICEHPIKPTPPVDAGTSYSSGSHSMATLVSHTGTGTTGNETKPGLLRQPNVLPGRTKVDGPDVLVGTITDAQVSVPLLSIKSCSHSTPDIIELIHQLKTESAASRAKARSEYIVCSPPCLHVSQKKAYGSAWSCGYRNIQMLCSSLMRIEEYRRVLFDGSGAVPEICAIQRWIETAWKAGFDTMGAQQLNHRLLGTSKWIGATECAALLRYFGIRAVIVDFPEMLGGSTANASGKRPFESTTSAGNTFGSSGGGHSGSPTMSERLVSWAERYFSPASNTDVTRGSSSEECAYFESTFLPPVYFQHQGHSRTIVGLQYSLPQPTTIGKSTPAATAAAPSHTHSTPPRRCLEQLLIFNPSSDATAARESLLQGNLRWRTQICKNRDSFKEDNYQLVYVAPGIMGEQERLRSRLLVGAHESAPRTVSL